MQGLLETLSIGSFVIIIIMLLDLLARFRPRTINKLSEGDSDANIVTIIVS